MNLQTGTFTADGNSTAKAFAGGEIYFAVSGSLGGGTLIAYFSTDNGATYQALIDSTTTSLALGTIRARLPDCLIRLTLTGSTTPSVTYSLSTRTPV